MWLLPKTPTPSAAPRDKPSPPAKGYEKVKLTYAEMIDTTGLPHMKKYDGMCRVRFWDGSQKIIPAAYILVQIHNGSKLVELKDCIRACNNLNTFPSGNYTTIESNAGLINELRYYSGQVDKLFIYYLRKKGEPEVEWESWT